MTVDLSRMSMAEVEAEVARRRRDGVGQRTRGVVGSGLHNCAILQTGTSNVVEKEEPLVDVPAQLQLVLPWSCLCTDNRHLIAVLRDGKPILTQTDVYRKAKEKTKQLAARALVDAGHALPVYVTEPLAMRVEVYTPRVHPVPDLLAPMKGLADALQSVCYKNDAQLRDVRWRDRGVDVDAPRCEITLSPLEP